MAIPEHPGEGVRGRLLLKILEAYEPELGSPPEVVERFCISYDWALKIFWQRRRTGQMEGVEQRHGPHKVPGVQDRIQATGAQLWYVPPA